MLVRGLAVQSGGGTKTLNSLELLKIVDPTSIRFQLPSSPASLPQLLPTIGHGHGTLLRQLFTSVSPSSDLGAFAQPPGAVDQPFFGRHGWS